VSCPVDSVERSLGADVAAALHGFVRPPRWLLEVNDAGRVAEALARWVPELDAAGLDPSGVIVKRLRLHGDTWVGQYGLAIDEGGTRRSIELRASRVAHGGVAPGTNGEPFATEGWSCYTPELRLEFRVEPPEEALTSLPALTDPERARALLERGLREFSSYGGVRVRACRPRVMRYKPGHRCTILYDLDYEPDGAGASFPNPVVAKTHAGTKGLNAHRSMTALWDSPLRTSKTVAIAEPLGFIPDANVLLQGPIKEETTLKQQLRVSLASGTPEELSVLRGYVEHAARGLAELHSCGVSTGFRWSFSDELADVRSRVERLARFAPTISEAALPLMGRLERAAANNPADRLVPSHRSFRPAQVLIHGRDIGFIDFDGFCQAEPALDLSLFCATLRAYSLRVLEGRDGAPAERRAASGDHLELLDELCDAFLESYERSSALLPSRRRVDLWHALLAFDRVVTCWTKNRLERLSQAESLLSHLYGKAAVASLLA
jgi:hypothetical protein